MPRNKDKEKKRHYTLFFVCFVDLSVPSIVSYIISDFLIETYITYYITYDNQLNSQFS